MAPTVAAIVVTTAVGTIIVDTTIILVTPTVAIVSVTVTPHLDTATEAETYWQGMLHCPA